MWRGGRANRRGELRDSIAAAAEGRPDVETHVLLHLERLTTPAPETMPKMLGIFFVRPTCKCVCVCRTLGTLERRLSVVLFLQIVSVDGWRSRVFIFRIKEKIVLPQIQPLMKLSWVPKCLIKLQRGLVVWIEIRLKRDYLKSLRFL